MRLSRSLSPHLLRKSLLIALAISVPLSLFGYTQSMGLAHSGGPLLLLYLPTLPVFALFGGSNPYWVVPDWLFNSLAFLAEFVGVFLAVHVVAVFRSRPKSGA